MSLIYRNVHTGFTLIYTELMFWYNTGKQDKRSRWTDEEKQAIYASHLKGIIKQGKVPGKADCEKALRAHPGSLRSRSWEDIKNWVRNHLVSISRRKQHMV